MTVASRGGTAELQRFRHLLNATIVATFVLIVIGGVVRVSDSGLGCGPAGSGTHGWPLCEGGLLPAASAESVLEYTHRIAAAVVGVLMAVIAWRVWRDFRASPVIFWGGIGGFVLVVIQAVLGGITVEKNLHEYLVAAHLGLAMLLIGLLIVLRAQAVPAAEERPARGTSGLRGLAIVAALLILFTIVAGGLVAGTEGHGRVDQPAFGAHMACGDQFPTCLGRFMPFGEHRLVDIQLTHRAFMYLAALAVLALLVVSLRQRVAVRASALLAALVAAQILLGAANVWFDKHAGLIVGHLTLGTLVWATSVYVTTLLLPVHAPASTASAQRDTPGTVPA
jgi:heme A synthase